jgi:hypothetical protein
VPYEVLCQGWREYSAEVTRPRKVELVFLAGGTYVPLERVDTLLVVQITQGNSHFGRCFGRRRGHTPAARPCSTAPGAPAVFLGRCLNRLADVLALPWMPKCTRARDVRRSLVQGGLGQCGPTEGQTHPALG